MQLILSCPESIKYSVAFLAPLILSIETVVMLEHYLHARTNGNLWAAFLMVAASASTVNKTIPSAFLMQKV